MKRQPPYFERIRQRAAQRWDQLELDPELAGPWHQLFKQVQSPRHILSELLQNADDAGAKEASVRIEHRIFIFEHNGEDFGEENFASLCRFGYSNKRALHTVGFRGVGFKSTFSLGDEVELFTPSLSICFHRMRFTEPKWLSTQADAHGRTRIQVKISDQHRQQEVEKNLGEWIKSPISLLFFKNIRHMRIGEQEVQWDSVGPGPVPESELMSLGKAGDASFLLIRSEAEAFPEEALNEIRQERMLGSEQEGVIPPCKVDIVLGVTGRLYVVLPTGVETGLPFACNAPFIQDPARLKIKDPETSPTNRWLLDRARKLAASAMLQWLSSTKTSLADRARAYALFPDVDREDNSLAAVCGTIAQDAFASTIAGKQLLLTEGGQLEAEKRSVIIPSPVLDVWEQAAKFLDDEGRLPLSQHVITADRKKLMKWDLVDEIDKQKLLGILQRKHLPRPQTWRQLLNLWAYIAADVTDYRYYVSAENVRIVPVQGQGVLYAASEIVRLGEKKLLQSEQDWEFLAKYLLVLNQNWPRFLADQRRAAVEQTSSASKESVEGAYAVLEKIGLDETSDVSAIIDRVATQLFCEESISLHGCVQLAQIAAKLGAKVGDAFRYATRDRQLRSPDLGILFDDDGGLDELLPQAQCEIRLLEADYSNAFRSCSHEEWSRWIATGAAGLLTAIPLVEKRVNFYGKRQVEEEAEKRGLQADLRYPYVTHHFVLEDWDFEDCYWSHWLSLASEDECLWIKLVDRMLAQRETYWRRAEGARLVQVATTGSRQSMTSERLLPSWVLRLQELPCLPDNRGFRRKPSDLLRRTPETESLMNVEPFVNGTVDREGTRALLDLLGVRSTPTGPDHLLDRLRALAKAERPPVPELEKWYRRLDQMMDTCSTNDFHKIKHAFQTENLILGQDGTWARVATVFLSSDGEDLPDVSVIRPSVSDLALWRKIGVAERPTADLAIAWLNGLPSGKTLSQEDGRRVRALIVRHPVQIWQECGHWINLAGEWSPVATLSYALTMQSLIPWRHLHQWVKQKAADLQRLPREVSSSAPFSKLPPLSAHIQERYQQNPNFAELPDKNEWLQILSAALSRVELEVEDETERVRAIATSLVKTVWIEAPELEIIPYIGGTPAGTARQAEVLWLDHALYIQPLPKARLARLVPEELGKAFIRPDIKAALDYCFERSAQDVRDYIEGNFNLATAVAPTEPIDFYPAKDANRSETQSEPEDSAGIVEATPGTEATELSPLRPEFEISPDTPASDTAGGQIVTEDADTLASRPRPAPKVVKPSLVERFAKTQGFRKDGEERFYHENGSWIARARDSRFSWERRAANGDLLRYYWPKEHCLEREPLQLEADIWGMIEQHPETHALILSNVEGNPLEITGARLRAMRDEGEVILYPASYRLVYDHDHKT